MTTENIGVPLENGLRGGITFPLEQYRFRLSECPEYITKNVESVNFDLVGNKISISVRSTVLPEDFSAALRFSQTKLFRIVMLDSKTYPIFCLQPSGLKCSAHQFGLSYGKSGCAKHEYEFEFTSLDVYEFCNGEPARDLPSSPDFPTISEAIEKLQKANNIAKED